MADEIINNGFPKKVQILKMDAINLLEALTGQSEIPFDEANKVILPDTTIVGARIDGKNVELSLWNEKFDPIEKGQPFPTTYLI